MDMPQRRPVHWQQRRRSAGRRIAGRRIAGRRNRLKETGAPRPVRK